MNTANKLNVHKRTVGIWITKIEKMIIRRFFDDCQILRDMSSFYRLKVMSADETTIYLDAPSNYLFDIFEIY